VAEGGGLLNRYTGYAVSQVRILSPPPVPLSYSFADLRYLRRKPAIAGFFAFIRPLPFVVDRLQPDSFHGMIHGSDVPASIQPTKRKAAMPRVTHKLTAAAINAARQPGYLGDGGGLYLHVGPTGGKSWAFRFMRAGKAREMGLGPLNTVGLADARRLAGDARKQLLDGIDPLAQREAAKAAQAVAQAKAITFREVADRYVAAHRPGWKSPVHAKQWDSTLRDYINPTVGTLPVAAIDTGHVTAILTPLWSTKTETASRVRGRIEAILDFAKTHGWRDGENPARWKGHLANVLPRPSKVRAVAHHAALPWQAAGDFMARLAAQDGVAALALRFAILTAGRTGEVLGATWREIEGDVWTVPPPRMKTGKEHRVPLSPAALAVLKEAALRRGHNAEGHVFPGAVPHRPLSNMALLQLLRRMGCGDLTAHGFRSTFRDWCAESGKPSDIAEAALAHTVGSKVVTAYARSDLLQRRRKLMQQWSDYCAAPRRKGATVVPLHASR
jgi:integrase